MLDHIELKVKDLGKAVAFYEAVLLPLGYQAPLRGRDHEGVRHDPGAGSVSCARRRQGHPFRPRGIEPGGGGPVPRGGPGRPHGKDNGAPGIRADYAPTYYAAFLIDPDGNNVEAVCLK